MEMPDGWVMVAEVDGNEVGVHKLRDLVFCKNCAHFRPNIHDRGDDSRCALWDAEVRADDYCSKARRKCNFCEIGGE